MVYQFFKSVVQILTRLFYKSIHVNGLENIPKDGPLLIAMNHPGGFMEPIILASVFPRPLYFLVRGDLFKKAWLKPLLDATNQLPIYRFKDGFSNMKKNQSVLSGVNQKLHNGKPILIYVEGSTEPVMQLRPLQKGLARMAFEALETKENLNLKILPVGINFTYPTKVYSEAMLNIGVPFDVKEFHEEFKKHPNQGYTSLTKATKAALKEVVLHVDNLDEYPLYEDILNLYRSTLANNYLPRILRSQIRYKAEKSIVDSINAFDIEKKEELTNQTKALKEKLQNQSLNIMNLQSNTIGFMDILVLSIGFPFAILGLLINAPYLYLAKSIADKKVKKGGFYASVMGSIMTIGMLVYYFLLLVILCFFFSWKAIFFVLGSLFLGAFAHFYFHTRHKWKQSILLKKVDRTLIEERDRILYKIKNS